MDVQVSYVLHDFKNSSRFSIKSQVEKLIPERNREILSFVLFLFMH